MKNLIIIIFFYNITVFSQIAVKQNSLDSGGKKTTVNNVKLFYAIGEINIQENSYGNISISEGIISPNIMQSLGISNYDVFTSFKVFPNPAIDYIEIKFENISTYQFILNDFSGRQVLNSVITSNNKKIDLSNISKGTYLLVIKNIDKQKYNSIKIIKN